MIKPEHTRINMYDAGIYYQNNRIHIEAEYLYKMYGHEAFKDVHAVNSFVNYDLPLKKVFNKISFLARYDMMTDHSNGLADSETGVLKINDYARHRVTGGITLSLSKAFIADLRLNFEKYFYQKSGVPKESERDKIVIEFMTMVLIFNYLCAMAQEVERKFLVSGDFKSFAFAQSRIMQGYICSAPWSDGAGSYS